MDFQVKNWAKTGQGHILDISWIYVGQTLDVGQRLDKSWDTHIVNQHPKSIGCVIMRYIRVHGTLGDVEMTSFVHGPWPLMTSFVRGTLRDVMSIEENILISVATMTTYFNYPSAELQKELSSIAKRVATPGKVIRFTILLIK